MDFMNIVLDAMGVLYRAGDAVTELLIPFLKYKGCLYSDSKIEKNYIECSLGKYSSGVFWEKMGLHDNVDALEDEYLDGHRLVDGLLGFLEELKEKAVRFLSYPMMSVNGLLNYGRSSIYRKRFLIGASVAMSAKESRINLSILISLG
jgi:hypothetical protein